MIGSREYGPQRRVGRAALWCALSLGAGFGLLAAHGAAAAMSMRPAAAVRHPPAAAPRQVKLVQPIGARRSFPLGAQRRPGKTITARRSLPR